MQTDLLSDWNLVPVHRFSRQDYERMAEAGVFEDSVRVELLDGKVVEMTPQGIEHGSAIRRLTSMLVVAYADSAEVGVQLPFAASDFSMPEPDLCVTPGRVGKAYAARALLVVEVAASSLRHDRIVKATVYAAAQVPEYWLVDVKSECIEVFTEPMGDHYGACRVVRPGDRLPLPTLPGRDVDVADVFAP